LKPRRKIYKAPEIQKGRQTSTGHLIPAVNSACRGKFAFQRASTGVPGEGLDLTRSMPETASGHVKYCINYGRLLQMRLHTTGIPSDCEPCSFHKKRHAVHAPTRDIRRRISRPGSPSFPALAEDVEETWMLVPLPTQRRGPEKLDDASLWRTSR
jgi:hypothetical protein